jgi:uncharacterized protein (DUF885 family)
MFRFCDEFVTRWAAVDPVGIGGYLDEPFRAATDYSPQGQQAWADLMTGTLSSLDSVPVTASTDRLAAVQLRERLTAQLAWHHAGEPLRDLRTPFGLVGEIRDSVDLLPRVGEEDWGNIAARLRAIPDMFRGWQATLDLGLARGLRAARRQAVEGAVQAEKFATARTHDALVASYGDGPLAAELATAALAAHAGYAEIARYLRQSYAPQAAESDGVGAERYVVAARLSLGADIDPLEAYEWGWAELARIEAEMAVEAGRVRSGASVDEAISVLDETEYVDGEDAYLDWLKARHAAAVSALDGVHFDIAPPLRAIDVVLAHGSTSGAAYYTPPSEDLSRPGRTWWPLGDRQRFTTWHELTTVFHEGVPGHHLQDGATMTAGDALSRFAKCTFISGHGEGWALYAERLADELGWFDGPGTRLGMLAASALRAARVVIDIGVHLDLPLPDGSRWTFEKACQVLHKRGRAEASQVHAEVVRYFGWPAQAISYKLGERAWLEARADAARRPGFDLKRWHMAALSLGPIGLDRMAEELRAI